MCLISPSPSVPCDAAVNRSSLTKSVNGFPRRGVKSVGSSGGSLCVGGYGVRRRLARSIFSLLTIILALRQTTCAISTCSNNVILMMKMIVLAAADIKQRESCGGGAGLRRRAHGQRQGLRAAHHAGRRHTAAAITGSLVSAQPVLYHREPKSRVIVSVSGAGGGGCARLKLPVSSDSQKVLELWCNFLLAFKAVLTEHHRFRVFHMTPTLRLVISRAESFEYAEGGGGGEHSPAAKIKAVAAAAAGGDVIRSGDGRDLLGLSVVVRRKREA
nr:hypothetical protein Iba_chr03aCG18770 [Ipomoea batatas]GMC76310.1 hypothetical protein Iba_chr03dCG13070 [Ipomoea batatas]